MSHDAALEILKSERDNIAAEIDAARAKLKTLTSRLSSLEASIAALVGAPEIAKEKGPSGPGLKATILQIIHESSGGISRANIMKALAERGVESTDNAVGTTLSRLKTSQQASVNDGLWSVMGGETKSPPDNESGGDQDFLN
ncbi:MAG: hypothetical protein J0H82_30055 [Alphaproteobacteria bacterium]|jgi:hypothetical protein|nr:hypothetical protein [Alphaproteobacteria bacterium]